MAARQRQSAIHTLARVAIWGVCAVVAISAAMLAANTQSGSQQLALAMVGKFDKVTPSAQDDAMARKTQQLAETVRSLSHDRDRLLARIDTIEQNLKEVTGSLKDVTGTISRLPPMVPPQAKVDPVPAPAAAPIPAPVVPSQPPAAVPVIPEPEPQTAMAVTVPALLRRPAPVHPKKSFAVDIGSAPSLESARHAWEAAQTKYTPLFDGLRPLVSAHDTGKRGTMELRLIAGPLPNSGAAAELCAALRARNVTCRTAMFDGQRLPSR